MLGARHPVMRDGAVCSHAPSYAPRKYLWPSFLRVLGVFAVNNPAEPVAYAGVIPGRSTPQ